MIADLHILRSVAQHLPQRFIGFGLDHFGDLLVGLSQQGRIVLRGKLSVIFAQKLSAPVPDGVLIALVQQNRLEIVRVGQGGNQASCPPA